MKKLQSNCWLHALQTLAPILVSSGNMIIASWLIWFIVCTWLTEFNDISVQYMQHSFRTQPELSNAKQSSYNIGGTYALPATGALKLL
jgi:hypothetical protein